MEGGKVSRKERTEQGKREGREANMDERQRWGVYPTGHQYGSSAGLGVRGQVKDFHLKLLYAVRLSGI